VGHLDKVGQGFCDTLKEAVEQETLVRFCTCKDPACGGNCKCDVCSESCKCNGRCNKARKPRVSIPSTTEDEFKKILDL
jgi:hypothetical protein